MDRLLWRRGGRLRSPRRGRGGGRRFVEIQITRLGAGAEELARAWGAASIVLDVQSFNSGAESFYRALGYRAATLRMSKRL